MQSKSEEYLTFAWWNTSLSPAGKSRADEALRKTVENIVKYFIDGIGVDCFALGEITSNDLKDLKRACKSIYYDYLDGTGRINQSYYDTGIIYNLRRLQRIDTRLIFDTGRHQTLKIAYRVDFRIINTKEPLHLFISHWPSRMIKENDEIRKRLGERLRSHISEINEASATVPKIILMGDYNDEPFDDSICLRLFSSRDRSLVQKKKDLLYNPFWRLLGESRPFGDENKYNSFAGTYYYKSRLETRWRTFDQVIVSASLLDYEDWHLDERCVKIWSESPLNDLIGKSNKMFDHFPIICVLKRRSNGNLRSDKK